MAERPGWMDYADLASKWTVPFAVVLASAAPGPVGLTGSILPGH
jgi:hypothetical protein